MRIFGKVDGTVDRFDRAHWSTPPFDLAFAVPSVPADPFFPRPAVRISSEEAAPARPAPSQDVFVRPELTTEPVAVRPH